MEVMFTLFFGLMFLGVAVSAAIYLVQFFRGECDCGRLLACYTAVVVFMSGGLGITMLKELL